MLTRNNTIFLVFQISSISDGNNEQFFCCFCLCVLSVVLFYSTHNTYCKTNTNMTGNWYKTSSSISGASLLVAKINEWPTYNLD